MTGAFLGSASPFFFFLSANADSGASIRPTRATTASNLMRFDTALAFVSSIVFIPRLYLPLRDIRRVHHIRNWMPLGRVPASVFQRQDHHFVLREVVFGQLDRAVEDRDDVFGLQFLRVRVGPMALEAYILRLLRS